METMLGVYLRSTGKWIIIEEEILDPGFRRITSEEEAVHLTQVIQTV